MEYDVMEFLGRVWGNKSCYVDLPSKINGHWIPFNIRWPDDREVVARRIESCLEDGEDVYFSVTRFKSRGRRISDTLPSRWLFADLDKVDPVFLDEDGVQPTIAWESSPQRFQCLWELDRALRPEVLAKLNRLLTYAIGADRSGWDLTQVLRPPGTRNHKYSPIADVEILWDSSKSYAPKALLATVKKIGPEHTADALVAVGGGVAVNLASSGSGQVAHNKLPARARMLLRTPQEMVTLGERSARLWELERLLADAGLEEDQIFDLVWDSAWNKHKEVHSGERQLRQEIRKAMARVDRRRADSSVAIRTKGGRQDDPRRERVHSGSDEEAGGDGGDHDAPKRRASSPFVDYATFLSTNIEQPRWLVEEIWSSSSHGIIGGEPKTSKSTIALALALSVASGRPFLGQEEYPVSTTGPVLYVQEEIAPWKVQDNLRKMAWYYGLLPKKSIEIAEAQSGSVAAHTVRLDFPKEYPLYILNNYGFDLTDDEDREMLEAQVRSVAPRLVILDPLYLISGGVNLNNSHELMPLMQWLMALRYNYDCAVAVVHHWHKAPMGGGDGGRRPGQRLMGSGLLHGWIESALYFEQSVETVGFGGAGDGWLSVRMEREFRNVAPRRALEIDLHLGEPGELEDMEVRVRDLDMAGKMLSIVVGTPGITLSALCEELGKDKREVRRLAVGGGCVMERVKAGRGYSWQVHPPGTELAAPPSGTPLGGSE